MRSLLLLLLLSSFTLAAQYPGKYKCVEFKAAVGKTTDFTDPDILEYEYQYDSPRENCDGIRQAMIAVVYKDGNTARRTANYRDETFFYFHGGGFRGGDVTSIPETIQPLVTAGYDVVSLEYRTGWVLCDPNGGYLDANFCISDSLMFDCALNYAVQDAKDGIDWTIKNAAALGIGTTEYNIGGTSAGGAIAQALSIRWEEKTWIDAHPWKLVVIGYGGMSWSDRWYWRAGTHYVYTHNNADNTAPYRWEASAGNKGRLFTNNLLQRNKGGWNAWDSIQVQGVADDIQFLFHTVCSGGHGLGRSAAFSNPNRDFKMWDDMFNNVTYGVLPVFLPAAEAGTFDRKRLTFALPEATSPNGAPWDGAGCGCEPNCLALDNCGP